MKLVVSTPLSVVVEADQVRHLRAEDESGAFGILPGHADFLTALSVSVITWRDAAGIEHYIAVRGGILEVREGSLIAVGTREAVPGDDLRLLEAEVLAAFHRRQDEERAARLDAHRLYLNAVSQIYRHLRPKASTMGGPPPLGKHGGIDQ